MSKHPTLSWRPLLVALFISTFWSAACGDDGNNQPPEFLGLEPDYRVNSGESLTINVSAKDPDGDDVTLSMESGPAGSDFIISGFGRFIWTPEASDAAPGGKPHDVVFAAVDSRGARSTFRAVILVEPSEGAIRFTTSNSRVLDLTRTDTLKAQVAVQRDDVTEVELTLENAPEGMVLNQTGGKSAQLTWTPSQQQVSSKFIWGAAIKAAVPGSEPAVQNLTVTLVAKNCGEGATEITHVPLEDQRGAGDYAIEAQIRNPQGNPFEATLFVRLGGDPNDSGGFDGVPMENTGGDSFRAVIKNPGASPGQPADLYYFIVAYSEAERAVGCLSRSPVQGLNSFAAFAAGDESCRQDKFEPNDATDRAAVLAEDTEGVSVAGEQFEVYGLAICEGDKDIFAIDLEANQGAQVLITYNEDLGGMHLRGLAPDGRTVVLESTDQFSNESSMLLPAATSGRYFIEVTGAPQGYRMYLNLRENVDPNCIDNNLEPNDSQNNAPVIPPGEYDDLRICPSDTDHYSIRVPRGNRITTRIFFSHADGDLDIVLRDPDSGVVGNGASTTDDEEIVYFNPENSRHTSFILQVRPINGAVVDYTMEILVEEVSGDECGGDFFEPNNTPQEANSAPLGDGVDGSTVSMCGDDDYYAVPLEVGQAMEASITFDHATSDLDLEILAPSLSIVARSNGTGNQERATWEATTAGTHYVRVFRFDDMGDQNYRLTIDTGGGGPDLPDSCDQDTNEENGARALALPIEDAQTSAVGLCPEDEDWFVVFLTAGQTVLASLEVSALANGDVGDVAFELHNGEGLQATGEGANGRLELEFQTEVNGPVFLRVLNNSEDAAGFGYNIEAIAL